uniref:Uncharacterized protein n=1 Tax=Anolis carolinensis TaxID=28377 RepID=A0A803SV58_ANOCA
MGSSSSKGRRKVTKVAPVPSKGERLAPQSTAAMYCFHNALQETNPNIFASSTGRNLILERQLPPLRETWQGRYPTGKPTISVSWLYNRHGPTWALQVTT